MKYNGLFLFSEASGDETSEEISEPTEDDAAVGGEDQNNNNDDTGGDEDDFGDGDDPGDEDGDDMDDDMGSDSGTADPEQTGDDLKKLRLLEEYEKLYKVTKELRDVFTSIDLTELTDNEMEIYKTLDGELSDNLKKLEFTMFNAYKKFKYERLLTIYIYVKSSIKVIAEIFKKISS